MSKRAQKKKRAELEALLTDRYEALGEVVLGMHSQRKWDDQILARGAAEVREVMTELDSLDSGQSADSGPDANQGDTTVAASDPGPPIDPESRADHLLAETAEHRIEDEPAAAPEGTDTDGVAGRGDEHSTDSEADRGEPTGEVTVTGTGPETGETVADPEAGVPAKEPAPDEAKEKAGSQAEQSEPEKAQGVPAHRAEVAATTDRGAAPEPSRTGASGPADESKGDHGSDESKTPAKVAASDPAPPGTEGSPAGLEAVSARIAETERKAKVASEAARAAIEADSKTELSAITRSIADEQSNLDRALEVAARRIHSAEREAENARARLTRELASAREAAASWVRDQADEIEADAALAQELASASFEDEAGGLGGDTGEARMQAMESEINSLRANLEAEKASKAEALAKAEVRVREIEAAAREAERKVDEARKWAPEEARLEEKRASQARLREEAVLWLRGQVASIRAQNGPDEPPAGDEEKD